MNLNNRSKLLVAASVLLMGSAGGYVWAQGPQGPPFGPGGFGAQEEQAQPLPASQVSIEERGNLRLITSNGIPNHPTGDFPNRNNPNAIRAQSYKFQMPLHPQRAVNVTLLGHDWFGVALNGIPFDPATAEFWNNDRRWNYDALSGKINLGNDASNAHVQPGGLYHYHGLPTGLIALLTKKDQMTLVGYAADGFPIYSNEGFTKPNDIHSGLKKLTSSHRLKTGTRPAGNDGPGGTYDGTFSADWEYVAGTGDLDDCNGRTGVTAEYPEGTYYYVLTDTYPFVPRQFHGIPDASFIKPRPGNGQGGPNGPRGPMGRGRLPGDFGDFGGLGGFGPPGPDGPPPPPFAW